MNNIFSIILFVHLDSQPEFESLFLYCIMILRLTNSGIWLQLWALFRGSVTYHSIIIFILFIDKWNSDVTIQIVHVTCDVPQIETIQPEK